MVLDELDIELLGLTNKQKMFCEEYIVDFNASRSVRDAGYSDSAANVKGSMLLTKVNIQSYIQHLISKRAERVHLTQDMVLKELMAIAFCTIGDFYCKETGQLLTPKNLPSNASKTASSFKTIKVTKKYVENGKKIEEDEVIDEYKRYDKIKALDSLAKHLGMLAHTPDNNKPTTTEINIGFV